MDDREGFGLFESENQAAKRFTVRLEVAVRSADSLVRESVACGL
jgi:hypothetical protein